MPVSIDHKMDDDCEIQVRVSTRETRQFIGVRAVLSAWLASLHLALSALIGYFPNGTCTLIVLMARKI